MSDQDSTLYTVENGYMDNGGECANLYGPGKECLAQEIGRHTAELLAERFNSLVAQLESSKGVSASNEAVPPGYRGSLHCQAWQGSLQYDDSTEQWRGRILYISDLVTYGASTLEAMPQAFIEAIFDYLKTCKEVDKNPPYPAPRLYDPEYDRHGNWVTMNFSIPLQLPKDAS